MSDHGHEHVHVGFGGAAVTFILLGIVEILLGIFIENPAVTNLGVHDLSDVIFPAVGIVVAGMTVRLRRHWPTCQAETWAAFIIGLSNILVIGVFTILSVPSEINADQLYLGVASGSVSFAANYFWAHRLHCEDDETRRAVSLHLRLDAFAAAAVAASSVLAYGLNNVWPSVGAAIFVLYLTVRHSAPELWRLRRQFHRQRNHLHLVKDHDGHHH